MAKPLYIAVEPFFPSDGEKWQKYYEWAKIPALTEVIGLDCLLCKRIIAEIAPEDWAHIVNEDFRLNYFYDLTYLLGRIADVTRRHVLGLYRNPGSHIQHPPAHGFIFVGYDLIEEATQISALTNCGGFPASFANAELNHFGLIDAFDRAEDVHRDLPKHYPEEAHAQCELYAIWKLREE